MPTWRTKPDRPHRRMELRCPFSGRDTPDGETREVPWPFVVDRASIHGCLWGTPGSPYLGDDRRALIVHDYWWQQGGWRGRLAADCGFRLKLPLSGRWPHANAGRGYGESVCELAPISPICRQAPLRTPVVRPKNRHRPAPQVGLSAGGRCARRQHRSDRGRGAADVPTAAALPAATHRQTTPLPSRSVRHSFVCRQQARGREDLFGGGAKLGGGLDLLRRRHLVRHAEDD